ncbi:MAG: CPBP family intramembrane metalloprotease [Thermoleophilia bacterium]|nr:CPBP family intramembrane metalloprotease [Thermoleophilia bacterium]
MSETATHSRADLAFVAAALVIHLGPLALAASLTANQSADLRTQAATLLPVGGLIAAAQVMLVVAARRMDLVGMTVPLRGGWTLTLPVWIVIGGIFLGAILGPNALPDAADLALLILAMALVAFNEEFTFRGAVMGAFMRRGSPIAAVVISSALFGLAHYVGVLGGGELGPTTRQVMAAALFGVALGLVRLRMPSLWPLVAMHGLWNVAVISAGDGASVASPGPGGTLLRVLGVILILSAATGVVIKAVRQRGRDRARSAAR